jgi:Ca2+-binding RTX toxin-like protein
MPYILNTDSIGATSEWFAEAIATISPDSTYGEIAEKYKIAAEAQKLVQAQYDVLHNENYPPNVQNSLSLLLLLAPLGGHDPGDLSETFAQAWNTIVTVPSNLSTGMTKDDFYADLEAKYPDLFVSDGSGGLIKPTLVDYPSSPDLSGIDVAHTPPAVPTVVSAAKTPWNAAFTEASPLVLDLTSSHTGIALTTFNASTTTTFFDIDNSGYATQTAWVGADMGLLCRDLNSNGRIDNAGELFGSSTVDGFALLSTLDSNGDHRIDQYDSAWSTLKIWVDANGDAVTQDGELHTLGSLNVASIDLAAVASSTSTVSGNPISHTSFFTFTNGTTATVADAWFVHDKVNSYFNGDYTLDVDTLFLPTLRGFGTLPDLAIAESQDSTLKGLVSDFASGFDPATAFADATTLNADITDILYRWAGVDSVDPYSRGAYGIDARNLEFMERFFGQAFSQLGAIPDPGPAAAGDLNVAWQHLYYTMKAALLTQAGADAIFGGTISYNPASGDFEGTKTISQDAIDALQSAAPTTSTSATAAYWEQVAEYINFTKGFTNVTVGEAAMLDDAISATDASLTWAYIEAHSVPAWVGISVGAGPDDDTLNGTAGNDSLDGGAGNDTLWSNGGHDILHGGTGNDIIHNNSSASSTLYGDSGNDTLYAGSGGDTLYGGDGNDTLQGGSGADILDGGTGGNFVYGGDGNDTYVFSGGNDVYDEYGKTGTDTVVLPSGITSGDLTFSRVAEGDSLMALAINVGTLGTIQINHFFSGGALVGGIETLTFSDSGTFSLSSLTTLTTYGTSGNDTLYGIYSPGTINDMIYGGAGNDVIQGNGGNDTFDGGAGNDTISGGAGNDILIASPGFDTFSGNGGTDIIQLPAGFAVGDVHFLRHSSSPYDLEITIDGFDQIVVKSQFSGYGVDHLTFSDSSTLSIGSQVIETVGGTGNDSLSGINSGASHNDILDGREGNDTLQGGDGNDTYIFSQGHDTAYENGGTSDAVSFGEGWSPGDITIYRGGTGGYDLIFEDSDGNSMTVANQYRNNSDWVVESARFSDSTVWNLTTMAIETHGTSGNDTIYSTTIGNHDAVIYGYAGNDQLQGSSGNNTLYGGDGADSLLGQSGNDILSGGDGSDQLTGGAGTDTFIFKSGETGSDTITDFSTSQGDKIDIHDILASYDPLTDAITDFVHVTASGSNAILSVDADGTAGGASFTQIATLTGLSSLAGHEADLLANGNLIAHAA